ncbi:hypothetical protein HDU78_003214 [Chytriomyces hyalinus]|nr:hypothetical protein HDU78_003214 [Chytriomyces hyalinus]
MTPLLLVLQLLAALLSVQAQNTYIVGGIYQQLQAYGSVRMLNATGFNGPSSGSVDEYYSSAIGVVYRVADNTDLDAFLAFSPPFVRFAVVLSFAMFTPSVLESLRNSNKLAGVIVVQQLDPAFAAPASDSPDAAFPQFQHSLYANDSSPPYAWNPKVGNGIMYKAFDFPIFVMPKNPNDLTWQQTVGTLLKTADYNVERKYQTYPLYAIELNQFMFASHDASVCLRRGWCYPAGATSIWSTFSQNLTQNNDRKLVVVTAQADANGFFQDFANAAATTVSGYVTLLAAAQALSENQKAVAALPSDILFTLFSSESFGFAGSQRFVNDISAPFTCKQEPKSINDSSASCGYPGAQCQNPCHISTDFKDIAFDRIKAIIEVNQVSGLGLAPNVLDAGNVNMYLHVDDASDQATLDLVKLFTESGGNGTVKVGGVSAKGDVNVKFNPAFSGTNRKLPPSSAMSFLAKKKIPAVVIGDYQSSFTNPYYNSIYDDGSQMTPAHYAAMCGVATQTARSVFQSAGGSATDAAQFSANCTLVADLFKCFTSNLTCSLFHSIYTGASVPYENQYPGFFDHSVAFTSTPAFMMYNFLANYTAYKRSAYGSCDSSQRRPSCGSPNEICVANVCVASKASTHAAYGSGIEMDYGSNKYVVVNAAKGTWVQSSIRTFLVTSPQYQGMQVGVGIALTLVVTAATYYVQKFVDTKFK